MGILDGLLGNATEVSVEDVKKELKKGSDVVGIQKSLANKILS